MNEKHLIDSTGRIELFGVTEGFDGYVIAEVVAVDEYVSTARATFEGKYLYTLELPGVCLNNDQPAAFNMVTLRVVGRKHIDKKPILKSK
ncbi:MAG: hypothetical protein ACRDBG_13790 [Waterburya sp.]